MLILAILLTLGGSSAQEPERADPQPLDAEILGLQLTVTISNERFCAGDADVYTQAFDIIAHYTNTGTGKLTVYTGTDVPAKVLVSRTTEDLREGRYEVEQEGDSYPMDGGRYMLGSNPKDERVVSLERGASAVSRSSAGVVVRKADAAKIAGTIGPGTHFLQVQMLVKVSEGNARGQPPPRARRGQRQGFRWVTVSSQPIEFQVPPSPSLQDCAAKP